MADFKKLQVTTDSLGGGQPEALAPSKKIRLNESQSIAEIRKLLERKRKERAQKD